MNDGGLSSIKCAWYAPAEPAQRLLSWVIARIGLPGNILTVTSAGEQSAERRTVHASDHNQGTSQRATA
jgi:hypothetical protein